MDDRDRQRTSSSKRNRQVFVSSRRDDRLPKSSNSQRRHDGPRRHGEDLRDRLSSGRSGDKGKDYHSKFKDRGGRDPKRRDQGDPRRSHHRPSHRDSDRIPGHRDERDARVQRMLIANMTKADSRRDVEEKRRQRQKYEKEAQEAELRIKRKRDRERQVEVKKPRTGSPSQQSKNSDDDTDENEDESESQSESDGSESSEADTASEQSGATPERDEESNADEEENVSGQSEEETEGEDESDQKESASVDKSRGRNHSDHSRTPSRSPTPRRKSSGDEQMDSKEEGEDIEYKQSGNEGANKDTSPEYASPQQIGIDLRNELPPYLPSILGCRSVDEFHCLNRIEEGTYGVVYRARDKNTNEIVALKRLKMEREKEGFPITSLREINTLLISQHKNVVHVREIVVGSNMDRIFIVMDFVEHDMKSLMETMRQKKQEFLPGEVKCLMIQLLSAIAHLHDNWILHRDLKTSNLLLSHNGILKVGDFGLAREYGSPLKSYTAIVVTLWYRAPELLLGIKEYSTFIDVWSIGCIFGEFLLMNPLFPGKSDMDELNRIFKLLGTPNERIWTGYNELPAVQKMKFVEFPVSQLRNKFSADILSNKGLNLLKQFLTYDPKQRITCEGALKHPYFDETPLAIDPSMFPTWPAKSEQSGGSAVKKAASPKPPSGGGAFKNINDDDVEARLGFSLNANSNIPPAAGWNLRF